MCCYQLYNYHVNIIYIFIQRLPAEYKTEAKLKKIEEQNKLVFDTMQKSMKSNDPIWKVPEFKNDSTNNNIDLKSH